MIPIPIEVAADVALQTDLFEQLSSVWDNFLIFTTMVVIAAGFIGLASGSLALGAHSGFVMFAVIAYRTGDTLLVNILTVAIVLVFVGYAFKLIRLEGVGD